MDFLTTITGFGDLYEEFLEEKMVIVFNDGAPPELAELAMTHTRADMQQPIKVGDEVVFGAKTFTVTAVGEEANSTLRDLGHCSFMFNGLPEAELPGQVELAGDGVPEVAVGDKFEIHFK